ncbi:MAG: trigger factor [Myxococcales bacterium]|nr:trigger factor [Myxococcales bacterium]
MKVDVTSVNSFQRKLTVVVPPGQVKQSLDRAYKTLSHQVRMPGFRPGKAPRRVLEARFGERVRADVANDLIQASWTDILQEGELQPVSQPSVDESGEVGDADGFKFIITVDVKPSIELQKWTGLEVPYPKVEIADDAVDAAVRARLEGHARLEPIEGRACEKGDMALVELHVFDGDDEVATEPGTMIRTEGDPYYPGIEEILVGMALEEEREGRVEFGEDAREEAIAGRTLDVKAKLLTLQSYQVPELTDEIAEELGFEGGAAGMRSSIQQQMRDQREEAARNQARANLLEVVIEHNTFDVPDGMVDQSLQMLMQELRFQRAYAMGRDPNTVGFTDAEVADLRTRAGFAARSALILEWVAEKESLEVTDADVDARYEELANTRGQTVEAVKGWFSKEGAVDELKDRILEEKTLDWMLERSTLVEQEASAETESPADTAGESAASTAGGAFAVLDGAIGALKDALATGEHDGQLDEMLAAEEGGRNRKGAVAAIKARLSTVQA